MCAGQHNLGTFTSLFNFNDVKLHTVMRQIPFPRNLFICHQKAFRRAQVHINGSPFYALDRSVNNIIFPFRKFIVNHVSLCFPDALHDDLLGILHGDAAEVFRKDFLFDNITQNVIWIHFQRFFQRNLIMGFHYLFNNLTLLEHMKLSGSF